MIDLDKINSIINKCRLLRQSIGITPREYMLSDLVEALAIELLHHDRKGSHVRTLGATGPASATNLNGWPTPEDINPPATQRPSRVWGGHNR